VRDVTEATPDETDTEVNALGTNAVSELGIVDMAAQGSSGTQPNTDVVTCGKPGVRYGRV